MSDCPGSCDCDLTLPVGPAGPAASKSPSLFNFFISGAPASTTSATYLTIAEFVFDGTLFDVFTAIKANIYMSAGTGSLKLKIKGGADLYENTAITSTSTTNIETATGLDVVPSADKIIQIQIKSNNGVATCFIGSATLYYGE